MLLYISVILSIIVSSCVIGYGLKRVRALEVAERGSQDEVVVEQKEDPIRISEDALGALTKLGYKKKASIEALKRATKETESSDNGILVRTALKYL